MKTSKLEADDEGLQKMLADLPPERVLAAYKPEQRVAGLAPEQVLALYDSEQLLLALPDNALRSLSADYLAMLSESTRAAIRARVGSESAEGNVDIRGLEGYDELVQKINKGVDAEIEARKQQIQVLIGRLPPDHVLASLTSEQVLAAYRSDPEIVSLTEEQVLAGLPPEQALAIFTPEQRLAGLSPDQALLALPDEVLRGFPDSYLATVSEPTRAAIRARIGR